MNLHERQQFDFFLLTACDRFVERIEQRCAGAENALRSLRDAPEGEGVWLGDFVRNLFADFLLDNAEGACWVLCALQQQKLTEALAPQTRVGATLQELARAVFADLLRRKCLEALEQSTTYGGRPGA